MSERIQIEVSDVAYGGDGVGRRADGAVVFVRGVLPGELVDVDITEQHRSYFRARLHGVQNTSRDRVQPRCPLAGSGVCPGCAYQHVAYPAEVEIKQRQLESLLLRIGGEREPRCAPPVASPVAFDYRNKLVLHASAQGAEGGELGYIGFDNRTVVPVDACPLAHPDINGLLCDRHAELTGAALDQAHPPEVTLRHTAADGVDWWPGRRAPAGPDLVEETPIGSLRVPRGSFFQTNPAALPGLVGRVRELVRRLAPGCLLEIYCGMGLFSIAALLDGVPRVIGVDADADAIRAAGANAAERDLAGRATFVAGDAARWLASAPKTCPGARGGTVLVDPPRAGLDRQALVALAALRPGAIIYVSCAPDTLARDIARFRSRGYRLEEACLVDMFPRTPHFETVALLGRVAV